MSETAKQAKERLGTEMVMIVQAKKMLTALDPLVGVAGKESDVRFDFSPSMISCGATDEGHTMLCIMEVSTGGCGEDDILFDYAIDEEISVAFSMAHMTAALKAFHDEVVYITAKDSRVCLWNDNRKRSFTMAGGRIEECREPAISPEVRMPVSVDKLKELASLEKMGETMHIRISKGRLVFSGSSDVESAEIYVPTQYTSDIDSSYGTELMTGVVGRIHTSKDEEMVTLGLTSRGPLLLSFSYEEADYRILIAPRLEVV